MLTLQENEQRIFLLKMMSIFYQQLLEKFVNASYIILLEPVINGKNPFQTILTFMASEAVICNGLTQTIEADQCEVQQLQKNEETVNHEILELPNASLNQNEQAVFSKICDEQKLVSSAGLIEAPKSQADEQPSQTLPKLKSSQQLSNDFLQNQKILASLSFNIDDLFKKISSLTEQVKSEIGSKPLVSAASMDKIESPRKKIQVPTTNSLKLIPVKQPECIPVLENKQNEIIHSNPFEQNNINIRMFELGQSLGHGKFGQVLECRHKQTGCVYALKKVFKSTIEQYRMADQFLIQLESMKKMDHPNVIKIYAAFTDEFHIFIVFQYALGQQLVKKFNSGEENVSKIIRQVLDALKYIHGQGVVHRDLKPQNIIIDELGSIKICDFGWSSLIEENQKMNILCGTLDYVCPQMALEQHYTKEVDLWSVGVLTYELIFGFAPFKAQNKSATFSKVKKLEYEFPGAYRFSSQCLDFITRLLKPEHERMRLEECLSHPFILNGSSQQSRIEEFSVLLDG